MNLSKILLLLLILITFGLIAPNGLRAAIANNLWSIGFVRANEDQTPPTSELSPPPATHPHAGLLLAHQALKFGEFDQAINLLKPLIEKNDPKALLTYAEIQYIKKDYQTAYKIWRDLRRISSLNRAETDARSMSRDDLVLQITQYLYEIQPEHYTANLVSRLENPEESAQILKNSIEDYPNSNNYSRWVRMLGNIYKSQGKWTEAETLYKKALDENNTDWAAWAALGWMYYQKSQEQELDRTIESFLNEITLHPNNSHGYYEISWAYWLDEQPEKAMQVIEKAIELEQTPEINYYLRAGSIYEKSGFYDLAIEMYGSALKIDPNNNLAKQGIDRLSRSDQ